MILQLSETLLLSQFLPSLRLKKINILFKWSNTIGKCIVLKHLVACMSCSLYRHVLFSFFIRQNFKSTALTNSFFSVFYFRKKQTNFWLLCIGSSICSGICGVWASLFDVLLKPTLTEVFYTNTTKILTFPLENLTSFWVSARSWFFGVWICCGCLFRCSHRGQV